MVVPVRHDNVSPGRLSTLELRKINQGRLEKTSTGNTQVRRRKDSCETSSRAVLRRLSWDSNSRHLLRRSSLSFERHRAPLEKATAASAQPLSPGSRRSTLPAFPLNKTEQTPPTRSKTVTSADSRVWSLRRDHALTRSLPRRLIPFKDRQTNIGTETPRHKRSSVTSLLKKPFTRHVKSTEESNAKPKKALSKATSVPTTPSSNSDRMGKKDFSLSEHPEVASPLAKRLPIFRKRQKSDNCELKSMSSSSENLVPSHRNASRVNSNNSDGSGPFSDASSIASDDEWRANERIGDYSACEDVATNGGLPQSFRRQRSLTCPQDFDVSLDLDRAVRNGSSIGHLASPLSSRSLPRINDRRRKKPLLLTSKTNGQRRSQRQEPNGGIYCGDDAVLEKTSTGSSSCSPPSSAEQLPVKKTPPSSPLRLIRHFQGTVKGLLGKDDDNANRIEEPSGHDQPSTRSSRSGDSHPSVIHSTSYSSGLGLHDDEDGGLLINGNEGAFVENHFTSPEQSEPSKTQHGNSRRHTVSATENSVLEARKILNKKSRPAKCEVIEWGNCFETLLNDTRGVELFRMFLRSEFSEENILFWLACEDLKQTRSFKVPAKAKRIYKAYIEPQAPQELNLDYDTKMAVTESMKSPSRTTFEQAQLRIRSLMSKDSYPRFLKSPIYVELLDS